MATVTTKSMTAEEFFEWCRRPDNEGRRFELDRGEVVEMPSPGELHGILCGWISHLLWEYVLRRGAGAVSSNDTGLLVESNPDTVRGPDVMLFAEGLPLERLNLRFSTRLPLLVVEILSPTDRPNKTNRRVGQYLRRGVPLVWLVDPETRTVGVHQPGQIPVTLDETEELTGFDTLPDFRLRVTDLFNLPGRQGQAE
jgi:Uma2 family endonuclease